MNRLDRYSVQIPILLTLQNNSAIQVQEAQVETAKFALLRTYQPFDPQIQSVLRATRTSYPGFSQIQGPGTFNDLNQSVQLNFTQTLQTGTNLLVGFNSTKDSSNSGFNFLNPYDQSFLNLQITQPLLRNRWRFENRAPLIVASKSLQQSRATFEAQVSGALLQAVTDKLTAEAENRKGLTDRVLDLAKRVRWLRAESASLGMSVSFFSFGGSRSHSRIQVESRW